MNETFLALSMCLCIGLFWAILFLFRALESRIRQDLTGLRGKEKYQYIHDRIGGRASSSDVVKEYLRNQGFYDSKDY